MARPSLEVADIFRGHGAAWRDANRGRISLDQLKVMSAIENCRTAALGGHVARCEDCAHTVIAYNSCRNRHCPKCQGAAARAWMAARETELLPVTACHVAAEGCSAAALDGAHHLELVEAQVATVGIAPCGPWPRKISATSRLGRATQAGYVGGAAISFGASGVSRSSGLMTSRMMLVATWV